MSDREITTPSPNPSCFANCKGMLELVGIYSNDVKELNSNFRKWAVKYHPDKGNGEKDFFSLVADCVRTATDYLVSCSQTTSDAPSFSSLKENDKISYTDDLGNLIYGIVVQLHPSWSPDKTHVVMSKTTSKWEPDLQAKRMYVSKESIKQLTLHPSSSPSSPGSSPSSPAPSSASPAPPAGIYQEISWRELKQGDKIFVTYTHVKTQSKQEAYGIFRSAPSYSEVIEYAKTDASFTALSACVSVLPLAGSNAKFYRFIPSTSSRPSYVPPSAAGSWKAGNCTPSSSSSTFPSSSPVGESTKKRKFAY
eukprot:TRINITY_DN3091_c0_g1_i1.p2 TRINITY_DN3091_c0_g1~~TRINITY_DN3091_c0_g1_i1.p2  ORF type:complete len:308 (-),score=84.45 TRINITY_DN3091_c0_g1_i1:1034-1957(-)